MRDAGSPGGRSAAAGLALSCACATAAVAQSAAGVATALSPEPVPARVLERIPARAALEERGVRLIGDYKAEASANVFGGERHDAAVAGQLSVGVRIDGGSAGLTGGVLQALATVRHGRDLSQVAGLGLLEQPQEVYGRGNVVRLTELSYQQSLNSGGVVFKAGRLPAGDFASFTCEFSNLSFCGAAPGNVVSDYWLNYPLATWAAWVKLRRRAAYLKVGVEEDNPNNRDEAFFVSRRGARGAILHAEGGWTPVFGGGRLPGRYVVGAWRSTTPQPATGTASVGTSHGEGRGGLYAQAQQQITGTATEDPVTGTITRQSGLDAFVTIVRADRGTSRLTDQLTAGLVLNAPMQSRPDDFVGLAIARTRYDRAINWRERAGDASASRRGAETVVEFLYSVGVARGLTLRPNLQYVLSPGGVARARAVLLSGVRLDLQM